jgi:restriction system protein
LYALEAEVRMLGECADVELMVPPSGAAVDPYREALFWRARRAAGMSFRSLPRVQQVTISLLAIRPHPTRGHDEQVCVLSVLLDRPTWEQILHERVTDENALRNFPVRIDMDSRSGEARPVTPFRVTTTATPGPSTVHLRTMDPLAFEALVKDLLTRMGYQAELTKASHDGGVDVVAVNPEPITGGRLVVQRKRYASTIGSPVVRDLYGALTHERASKAILITTSGFSPDAIAFAEGKPIELINGRQLEQLCHRYGIDAHVG